MCLANLDDFMLESGDIEQWRIDGIDKIHRALWDMAIDLWGFPV